MARALPLSTGNDRMITSGLPAALLLLQAAPGGGSIVPIVVQFALIIAIIYWFMFRPQQKARKDHEALLKSLKRGDEIVTAGGIVGEVLHIRDMTKDGAGKALDDRVTIKSAESRLIVERGRIAKVIGKTGAAATTPTNTTLDS
jgi:preprotein translocase subunit YajC